MPKTPNHNGNGTHTNGHTKPKAPARKRERKRGELRFRWWDGRKYRILVFHVGNREISLSVKYRASRET